MARRGKGIDPHTETILKKFKLDPKECLWDCHGTWILLHKWVSVIGQRAGVELAMPEVIHCDPAGRHIIILVGGMLGDAKAWSFGEASPQNNKNAYPMAMAEKRAKDRVILELVGLAGHVYTDQDVPEIKDGKPVWELEEEKRTAVAVRNGKPDYEDQMRECKNRMDLMAVAARIAGDENLSGSEKGRLRSVFGEVEHDLGGRNG